jgi:hypothetical protein
MTKRYKRERTGDKRRERDVYLVAKNLNDKEREGEKTKGKRKIYHTGLG